jgi:hypothetical protein
MERPTVTIQQSTEHDPEDPSASGSASGSPTTSPERVQRIWERIEQEAQWREQRNMFPNLRQVQGLFRRFNRLYFGNALRGWRVRYGNRPWERAPHGAARFVFSEGGDRRPTDGYTDRPTRTIYLGWGLMEPALSDALLHEMIHAAGVRDHGAAFRNAQRRLVEQGAPLTAAEVSYSDTLKEMRQDDRKARNERRRALRAAGLMPTVPGTARRA